MQTGRCLLLAALVSAVLPGTGGTSAQAAGTAAWTPVHAYRGAVPVLCYHGLGAGGPYSITGSEFASQMGMLSAGGFHTISIAQYARFAAGDVAGLPDRPILITFDDGRLDSYRGADGILARYGMRATMFVITANAAGPKPGYLSWAQLVAMAASGRWDLQEHAHAGHVLIPSGPGNQTGPYYANLLYRNGVRERFTAFKRRVSSDILTGRRLMASHIPGFEPLAFAPPYDSYGQLRTNYAPIPGWERVWLQRTFRVIFLQDRRVYNLPGNPIGQRYGIHSSTTAGALYSWLRQALPRAAWVNPVALPPAAKAPSRKARPARPHLRRLRTFRHRVVIAFDATRNVAIRLTRRRAGHRSRVRVAVSPSGWARDRRLRARTRYVYRAVAVDSARRRSRTLRLVVHTR